MKSYCIVALYLTFFLLINAEDPLLHHLNSDSFDAFIQTHSDVVVEFHAPWCSYCQRLKPIYLELADDLKSEQSHVVLAEVDITESPRIGRKLQLSGIPVIMYYKGGKSSVYEGKLEKLHIREFINDFTESTPDNIKSIEILRRVETLKKRLSEKDGVVVGYINDGDKVSIKAIDRVILEQPDILRVFIYGKEMADAMSVPFPSVVLYRSSGESIVYSGEVTESTIGSWFMVSMLPLIVPYTAENTKIVFSPNHDVTVRVLFVAPIEQPSALIKATQTIVEAVATKYRGRVIFLAIPAENSRLLGFYGIQDSQVPAIVISHQEDQKSKKYRMEDNISEISLSHFIDQFFLGKLTSYSRSEREPNQFVGPVYKAVGTTFHSIVYSPSKDVVVRFYAPWCGKSSDFEPIYEMVAREMMNDSTIQFVDFDATKNEVDEFDFRDFPTVLLFKANSNGKLYERYEGELEIEPFKQFILMNHQKSSSSSDEL